MIMASKEYLKKVLVPVVEWLNKQLYSERKRLKLIVGSEDVPSPGQWKRKDHSYAHWTRLFQDAMNDPFVRVVGVTDTNSMDPLIDAGHGAIMREITGSGRWSVDRINPGDVISFVRPSDGLIVLHRVVGVRKYPGGNFLFKTLGDNVVWPDGWIPSRYVKEVQIGVLY